MFRLRFHSHGFGNLPTGLKTKTQEDLYATSTRREWDRITESQAGWSDARLRMGRLLEYMAEEQTIDRGQALDCLIIALKKLSTDSVNPTLDTVPEEKIWKVSSSFLRLTKWVKETELPMSAMMY